jgi:class 3 adenylate cyclase
MESHGLPGRIQVAEGTRRLLADDFELESRGVIEVKGKGQIPAWLLNGRKAKAVR